MIADSKLKEQYNRIARWMEQAIISQAPRDTGKLASSVSVTYELQGISPIFKIGTPDVKYGIFIYEGTGSEKDTNPGGKNPSKNPGKGEGGIKPTYFLNLNSKDKQRMRKEVAAAIKTFMIEEAKKELTKEKIKI
jgi:hypothetical protein